MTEARAKIFIVDDHAGMRSAMVCFVAREFEVIGTAASAEEALQSEHIGGAAVVVVDVSLPRISGIDLVRELRERWPDLRCLMLSGHDSLTYVKRSLAAGARGYLRKEDPDEILEGIRQVNAGRIFICQHFRRQISQDDV
jgi:DNA-binding NarL/FixJ family response regulator